MNYFARNRARRAAVAPLVCLLLVPLLGMAAFAVDVGWMVLAQSDLQNAADAAALAGSQQLLGQEVLDSATGKYNLTNGFADYYTPGQSTNNKSTILSQTISRAQQAAVNFASYQPAGGVASLALRNPADIEFGITDSSGNYTALTSHYTSFPNTVNVTI